MIRPAASTVRVIVADPLGHACPLGCGARPGLGEQVSRVVVGEVVLPGGGVQTFLRHSNLGHGPANRSEPGEPGFVPRQGAADAGRDSLRSACPPEPRRTRWWRRLTRPATCGGAPRSPHRGGPIPRLGAAGLRGRRPVLVSGGPGPASAQFGDDGDQVLQGTAEPVERCDHEHVPRPCPDRHHCGARGASADAGSLAGFEGSRGGRFPPLRHAPLRHAAHILIRCPCARLVLKRWHLLVQQLSAYHQPSHVPFGPSVRTSIVSFPLKSQQPTAKL